MPSWPNEGRFETLGLHGAPSMETLNKQFGQLYFLQFIERYEEMLTCRCHP
jgi:hypothetical protein